MNAHTECETLEHTALNAMCPSNPPRTQGNHKKRRRKECKRQRGRRTPEEQGPLNQLSSEHINSPRLKRKHGAARGCTRSSVSVMNLSLVFLWGS